MKAVGREQFGGEVLFAETLAKLMDFSGPLCDMRALHTASRRGPGHLSRKNMDSANERMSSTRVPLSSCHLSYTSPMNRCHPVTQVPQHMGHVSLPPELRTDWLSLCATTKVSGPSAYGQVA